MKKVGREKWLFILALVLIVGVTLHSVFATEDTITIELDNLSSLGTVSGVTITKSGTNNVLTITSGGKYLFKQGDSDTSVTINIVVNTTEDISITLDNINIVAGSYATTSVYSTDKVGTAAISIEGNTNCKLILKDGTTNNISGTGSTNNSLKNVAGISVENTISDSGTHLATLTIEGESGDDSTGVLNVTGGMQSAAIGGNCNRLSGNITINSGKIYATSGDYGAAIGDGDTLSPNETSIKDNKVWTIGENVSVSNITINGGYIYATATMDTPGIGTADNLKTGQNATVDTWTGMKITINGGEVITIGGSENYNPSAGIGAGSNTYLDPNNIIINKGVEILSVTRTNDGSYPLTNSGGQTIPEINSTSSANVLNLKLSSACKANNLNFWVLVDGVYEQIAETDFPNALLNDMGDTEILGLAVVLPDGTYRITDDSGNIIGDDIQLYNGGLINGTTDVDTGTTEIIQPIVLTSPTDVIVNPTDTATFTVESEKNYSTSELSYVWYKSTDTGSTWTQISGATSNTLTLNNVSLSDDGTLYKVEATKIIDNDILTETSTIAKLTVTNDYSITLNEKLDGNTYTNSGNSYALYQNNKSVSNLEYNQTSNNYTQTVAAGTYDLYANGTDTGMDITVSKSNTKFEINYHTLNLTVTSTNQNDSVTVNNTKYKSQSTSYNIILLENSNVNISANPETGRTVSYFAKDNIVGDSSDFETNGYTISSLSTKANIVVEFAGRKYPLEYDIKSDTTIDESKLPTITLKDDTGTYNEKDNIPDGTYSILIDGVDSNQDVTITSGKAELYFYSIELSKDDGISSISGDGLYLKGTTVSINTSLSSGYNFDGWYNGNTKLYSSMKQSITNISKSYSLKAKATAQKANEAQVTGSGTTTTYGDGNTPVVSVVATTTGNEEITYQWYKTDEYGNDKEIIDGATSSSYITDDKDAGNYYYYCEVTTTRKDNNEKATVGTIVETVINKAILTINVEDTEKEYTGLVLPIDEVKFDDDSVEATYTYYLDRQLTIPTTSENSGSESEGTAPKNVGTYYVKITTKETTNYSSESKIVKLTIVDKKNNTATINNPSTNRVFVYTGYMILLFTTIGLYKIITKKRISKNN